MSQHENDKLTLLYEEMQTPTVLDTPKTMQLHDFLEKTLQSTQNDTDAIKKYVEYIHNKKYDLQDSYYLGTILWALYTFAQLRGYREGLNEGRGIESKYHEKRELSTNDLKIINEANAQLKELAEKYKAAKAANNQEELKTLTPQIIDVIAEMFAPEAKEAVEQFEAKGAIKTTRGNYGKYMSFLSNLQGLYLMGMIKALKSAGAGRGLDDAIMVLRGPR